MNKICVNPAHDHELEANDVSGQCNDCGKPTHYDEGTEQYHHDDGTVCFLTMRSDTTGKTPCAFDPQNDGDDEDFGYSVNDPWYLGARTDW